MGERLRSLIPTDRSWWPRVALFALLGIVLERSFWEELGIIAVASWLVGQIIQETTRELDALLKELQEAHRG